MDSSRKLKVFRYLPELDCFVVEDEFKKICDYLGVTEWHSTVWLGRLFILDNDLGEHWFDNWDEREAHEEKAAQLGYDSSELLFIAPSRMQDGSDGPCHTDAFRKRFWTDVLSSLTLSLDLLFDEARQANAIGGPTEDPDWITDLEERIANVLAGKIATTETPPERR